MAVTEEIFILLFTLSENYRDAKKIINEMKRKGFIPNELWYSTMYFKDIYESDVEKVIKDYERIHKREPLWDNIENFTMRKYEIIERKEFKEQLQTSYPSLELLMQLKQFNGENISNNIIDLLPKDRVKQEEEDDEYFEGKEAFRLHRYIERNQKLVKDAKKLFAKKHKGKLFCEICEFDFNKTYGERGEGFIEAHHTKPISEMKENGITKIEDMIMLCSNCHRMIHKNPFLRVDELLEIVNINKK